MTLFWGASPSYVREAGSKPNASWRAGERRVIEGAGDRSIESSLVIAIGT
jgi:hypothetical protein